MPGRHITDQQVRRYMQSRKDGYTQAAAAARAGFSESTARRLDFHDPERTEFLYIYDFGDSWEHLVQFERLLAVEPAPRVASCIGGARAHPPEDVGGVHGYADFLEIIADPSHPEHHDTQHWAGGHFDPEWFDVEVADKDVRNALRSNRRIRLHQPRPKRQKPPL